MCRCTQDETPCLLQEGISLAVTCSMHSLTTQLSFSRAVNVHPQGHRKHRQLVSGTIQRHPEGLRSTGHCRRHWRPQPQGGRSRAQGSPGGRRLQPHLWGWGPGWGQGSAGRVRVSALHGPLPPAGKRHLGGLREICEWGSSDGNNPAALQTPHMRL